MSHFRCVCGHRISDTTDCLPYKAYIRMDEDTQKPIELAMAQVVGFIEARAAGTEAEAAFLRQCALDRGEPEDYAQSEVNSYLGKPLNEVLESLIFHFWNNYDHSIYECEMCGRLWVETDGNMMVSYLPQTDVRGVLWSRRNHNPYGYLDR